MQTDPTGEVAWLLIPMAVGIVSSVEGNLAEQIASGGDIDMGSVGKAAATGAITGALREVGAAVKALKVGGTVVKMIKNGKAIDKVDGMNKNAFSKDSLVDHAVNVTNSAVAGTFVGSATGGSGSSTGSGSGANSDAGSNTKETTVDKKKEDFQ